MLFRSRAILCLVSLIALDAAVPSAQASTINYITTGDMVDMGLLTAGNSGVIDTADTAKNWTNFAGLSPNVFYDYSSGLLASNTKLTITYSVVGTIPGNYADILRSPMAPIEYPVDWGPNPDITIAFVNSGMSPESFSSALAIYEGSGYAPDSVRTSYYTTSLSPVPLPAAMSLFGSGFLGLVGFVFCSKKASKSATL